MPRRLGTGAAAFDVTLDTHSGDLDVDLSRAASQTIGGEQWRNAGYRGDGPSHHREGVIRFRGSGPTQGEIRLRIPGLDRLRTFRWRAEETSR